MASEPPVAVYDACVLYPFHLRNVLIQCAFDGLVEARWTNDIHAEWIRNLAANSTDTPISRFEATRDRMKAVLPGARAERSRPIVADLFAMLDRELPRLSGKSKLAEIIRYTLSRRAAFERFLADGRIEIDSNIVERAIRPQTITRKNALFAGSDGGGRAWATIATLLTTAKMNSVDPNAWLTQTLERIAGGWPNSQIDDLMPWNFRQ